MKQILQSYRAGELWLADVPAPMVDANSVLAPTSHSIVSAGTESMVMELAKKSLLKKAMARPGLVRQVLQKIRSEGLKAAMEYSTTPIHPRSHPTQTYSSSKYLLPHNILRHVKQQANRECASQ